VTTWVVDTSPLIFLAKLGRLDLLRRAADTVCTPQAVLNEIQAKPDERQPQRNKPPTKDRRRLLLHKGSSLKGSALHHLLGALRTE
jgi:predicted nucleic acid-binding protein